MTYAGTAGAITDGVAVAGPPFFSDNPVGSPCAAAPRLAAISLGWS